VPINQKLREKYDPSQQALNSWLKDNPVGKMQNGGKEMKFKMDLGGLNRKLDEFKLFRDVEKQAREQSIKRHLQNG